MAGLPVRVYLVDDSAALRDMLGELLTEPGRIEVIGASGSATAAVPDIERMRPDVVILDLQLADGDGFAAAGAIRALSGGPVPRIVFFTNHQSAELRRRALALGLADYLDKTLDHERLVALLAGMAGARGA